MISIENLSKQYGATTVVDRVSMAIERNSITVIVGTSGSGKSTLLRMINRLVEPTGGRVLIDGSDTAREPAHLLRRRIGYAIQSHGLFPHRTVAENIATVPGLLGWDEARIRMRVDELLQVFQLEEGTQLRRMFQWRLAHEGRNAMVGCEDCVFHELRPDWQAEACPTFSPTRSRQARGGPWRRRD